MQFSTDPKVIGPGSWFILHWGAWVAREDHEIDFFIKMLYTVINNFPCGDCKKHALEFITKDGPENYKNWTYNGEKLGMFYYLNKLHNWPNSRLGKRIISFDEAYNAFANNLTGFCSEGCGHEEENVSSPVSTFTPVAESPPPESRRSYQFVPRIVRNPSVTYTKII